MKKQILFFSLLVPALIADGALHAQSTGLVVTSSNNVGIGTANPQGKLHVSGAVNDKVVLDNGMILSQKNAAGNIVSLLSHYSNDTVYLQNPNGPIDLFTTEDDLYIKQGGNVGIGTTGPGTLLHVKGSFVPAWMQVAIQSTAADDRSGISFWSSGGARMASFYAGNDGNSYLSGTEAANSVFHIFSAGAERMTFLPSGNVGIGTSAPLGKLDINGTSGGSGFVFIPKAIGSPGTGNRHLSFEQEQAWGTAYFVKQIDNGGTATNDVTLEFFPDNSNANPTMVVQGTNNGGNVGIGTASPGYKLDVNGSVHATSFISATNTYADFVFKPDYKLAPLNEVEATIKKDGHLPGIPSEEEAKAHGIDLAQMQVRLLQKIEELTLHQIEQEKELKAQSKEIENLKKENVQLRAKLNP
ncbi:MAG TPA: hypothetical protein VFB27_02645 [Opitutaceae bacterium]|nr:hypothetical protein [Opitutaceae bacterium]